MKRELHYQQNIYHKFFNVAPGVWGNAILHTHLRKTMASALAATATVPEACVLLNRQASSRQRMESKFRSAELSIMMVDSAW